LYSLFLQNVCFPEPQQIKPTNLLGLRVLW